MRRVILTITTNSGGDGSAQSDAQFGLLYAVEEIVGTFSAGVDLTLTSEQGDLSIPLLTHANFNTTQIVYPRVLENLNTDGTQLSTHTMPLVAGSVKAVIAQGGNAHTGTIIAYIMETP